MSFDPSLFAGPVERASDPLAMRATVARAPVALNDGMAVAFIEYGQDFALEVAPGHWDRSSGLPEQDAICLVVFDERMDPWVTAIEGESAPSTGSSSARAFFLGG